MRTSKNPEARRPPLKGLRVLDLTHVIAGPTVTQVMADLGAEVIKVEAPPKGEIFRETAGLGPSAFLAINRGKKSVLIDVKKEEGLGLFFSLVKVCDVVIENLSPEAVRRIGLDYRAFKRANPRIIYCRITSFGEGPYEDVPAWDPVLQAASGIMSTTGRPPDGYARAGISLVDMTTGFHATIGILGALLRREKTGKGAFVEVSMLDSALYYMGYWLVYLGLYRKNPAPLGTSHFFASPYGLFEARGGRVYVAVTNDDDWKRFCRGLGFSELAKDKRYSTASARVALKEELEAEIGRRLRDIPLPEVLEALARERVPHSRMNTVSSLLDDPVVASRRIVRGYRYGGVRPGLVYKTVVNPVRFDGVRPHTRSAPPRPGEHTDEVLSSLLRLSGAEIRELRASGVVR